jgi:hypothetical protein
MATWKKIIISGSNAHLNQITSSVLTPTNLVIAGEGGALQDSNLILTGSELNIGANSIISTGAGSIVSGSFSGSFEGDGSGLTGVSAQVEESLNFGAGLFGGTFDGLTALTASVDSGSLAGDGLTTSAGAFAVSASDNTIAVSADGISVVEANLSEIPNTALTNSGSILGSTPVALGETVTSIAGLTLTDAQATGSFTGSFVGDGSGLTGLVTNLDVSGSDGSGISIDLLTQDLTIGGTANEIETTVSGTTVTIGLPDDVTIGQDLVVSRNLTVLGTASFQNTENLLVADRFVLFASGSNTAGDGGIVVQQDSQGIGETFAYDAETTRWGVTGSFDSTQNSFTPEAFMATVIEGGAGQTAGDVVSKLTKKGNIFIQDNEDIWIFS